MKMRQYATVALLLGALMLTGATITAAQSQGDLWRTFAVSLDPGTELTVRLNNGQRFRATLVRTTEDALFLQPKTRVPVPVQPVPYDAIVSIERRSGDGIGAAKAAVIGVAAGAGTFLAILLMVIAAVD
jgi:hypothetical protein